MNKLGLLEFVVGRRSFRGEKGFVEGEVLGFVYFVRKVGDKVTVDLIKRYPQI